MIQILGLEYRLQPDLPPKERSRMGAESAEPRGSTALSAPLRENVLTGVGSFVENPCLRLDSIITVAIK